MKRKTKIKNPVLLIMGSLLITALNAQEYRKAEEAEGLTIGSPAPLFEAGNAQNKTFNLENALKEGPLVLIFYRGFWCPVCNKHLAGIQDSLKLIQEQGARVVAVSPEKPEYLDKMADKSGARFTLLYDEEYKIADAYDVTFRPSGTTLFTYNTFLGAKLKKSHSDDSQRLPIPATYLIDQDGKIAWRQFDPDYKNRSSVKDILKALKQTQ